MRVMKIRIWNTRQKTMHYNDVSSYCSINDDGTLNTYNGWGENIPEQFIGLSDTKSIEAYEGDKIRILGGEEHQGYRELDVLCEIIFSNGSFYAVDENDIFYDFGNIDEFEIIGNIHE